MTTITERVTAPELLADQNTLKAITKYQATLINIDGPQALTDIADKITTALAAGRDVPLELADSYLDLMRDFERAQTLKNAAQIAADNLRNKIDSSNRISRRSRLELLRDELARVIEQAQDAADRLNGARSAEEAIAAGGDAPAAWSELAALADEYDEIRSIQMRWIREEAEDSTAIIRVVYETGQFANSIDIHPAWAEARWVARAQSDSTSAAAEPLLEWYSAGYRIAQSNNNNRAWSTTIWPQDRVPHLLWILDEAVPWLPTLDELNRASESAHAALQPSRAFYSHHPAAQLAALADYYATTGARPTIAGLSSDATVAVPGRGKGGPRRLKDLKGGRFRNPTNDEINRANEVRSNNPFPTVVTERD